MAEGEDWQDRISSQNIEKTDRSSVSGSVNSEGESWQDRISSGTKDQEKTKDPLAGLSEEQKQTLLLIKMQCLATKNGWLKKVVENKQISQKKLLKDKT